MNTLNKAKKHNPSIHKVYPKGVRVLKKRRQNKKQIYYFINARDACYDKAKDAVLPTVLATTFFGLVGTDLISNPHNISLLIATVSGGLWALAEFKNGRSNSRFVKDYDLVIEDMFIESLKKPNRSNKFGDKTYICRKKPALEI